MSALSSVQARSRSGDTLAGVTSTLDIPARRSVEESRAVALTALQGSDVDEKDVVIQQLVELLGARDGDSSAPAAPPSNGGGDSSAQTTTQGVAQLVSLLPESILKRATVTIVLALALVQPVVANLSQSFLGESDVSALEGKLNAVIEAQAKSEKQLLQAAAFVVESEIARRNGTPLPRIPPTLSLMAAMDKVQETTGQ